MSITVIYSREEKDHTFSLTKNRFLLIPFLFIILFTTSTWFIQSHYKNQLAQFKITALNEHDISKDKYLQLIKIQSDEKLIVLSSKLGELEAKVSRLNMLGERLVEKSKLPKEEFDFETIPATGKVEKVASNDTFQSSLLLQTIENIDLRLIKKEKQLTRLEIALNNRHLLDESFISGRPVRGKGSWISSLYGTRKDPFSGKLRSHKGVDIAGPTGMPLVATAAGVVIESGKRGGYGLMVELHHGNGLVTRYAHAIELTVKVGEIVSKGQQVAVMGSSGRSTGPHIHYEVLKNGRQVDPDYYIHRIAG
ncbi:M23 family metallopeptidase [Psychromonas sp. Urea-02u-13]|uniref:M23 family metallopeptidase n=1 Tax=Psychromonas sp. Urea-02u-13 TaxID=2058326 RepID=UPI000C32A834|nr:M23 family metallopeptidase [Psychromonas sp. Urea-02u-13]PKG38351.1 M23 family peptidase [Psychromonas sp. Urea-02u-13]